MLLKVSKWILPATVSRFNPKSGRLCFTQSTPSPINLALGVIQHHKYFSTSRSSLMDSEQTFQLLIGRLQQCVAQSSELQKELSDDTSIPASYDKKKSKEQIQRQISQLAPLYALHEKIKGHRQNIKDLHELIAETKDKDEKELLKEQIESSNQQLEELKNQCWELLIPPSPFDHADDIILQFRPGAGGSQSCIFVQDLSEMYETYCGQQGWRCTVSNSVKQVGVSRGYKMLDLRVQGSGAHKVMKCEAGVHKVIRIPETQSKGRIHSSTISMIVMPVVPFTFNVDPKDIKYQFTRSSGPGGQAVNKIQSACRATHIPTGLQVFIQEERSQQANKKRATEILKQRVFQIEYKRANEEEQSKRKSQVTTMDRSEKIRTYNYPQDRITDHRTGLTKFGMSAMMNGDLLQEFIGAYIESVNKEKVEALVSELYVEAGIVLPKK